MNKARLLLFTKDSQLEGEYIIEAKNTLIGRTESADIQLANNKVSRIHAQIFQTPLGYFISDMNSTNGTYLNDQNIRPNQLVRLSSNDTIAIGDSKLTFQLTSLIVQKDNPSDIPDKQESMNTSNTKVPASNRQYSAKIHNISALENSQSNRLTQSLRDRLAYSKQSLSQKSVVSCMASLQTPNVQMNMAVNNDDNSITLPQDTVITAVSQDNPDIYSMEFEMLSDAELTQLDQQLNQNLSSTVPASDALIPNTNYKNASDKFEFLINEDDFAEDDNTDINIKSKEILKQSTDKIESVLGNTINKAQSISLNIIKHPAIVTVMSLGILGGCGYIYYLYSPLLV